MQVLRIFIVVLAAALMLANICQANVRQPTGGLTRLDIVFHASVSGGATLTDQAAAEQFIANHPRNVTSADISNYTQVRLSANVVSTGAAGSKITAKYKAGAYSSSPAAYSDIGASEVSIPLTASGTMNSAWTDLATGAKADVMLAVMQSGGDAAADPNVNQVRMQFR